MKARALARLSLCVALVASLALGACSAPVARPVAASPAASSSSPPVPVSPAPSSSAASAGSNGERGGSLTVRFLDIGQGDSALLTTSDHHAMLVDAGPLDGAAHLEAALATLQGAPLDMVVLSHAHADHLGELDKLTESSLNLHAWLDPGFNRVTFHPYADTLKHLTERHIEHRIARRGARFELGTFVSVEVLEPEEPFLDHTRSDINANSVVLRVVHRGANGDARFLFEGDAEEQTEKRLLQDPEHLRADVLKVAHHGSRYASSDALLDAVAPRFAVISCAQGNDYGHPHKETLGRLEKHRIEVARTDVEGTVTMESNAEGLHMTTERHADAALLREPGRGLHPEAAP